MEINTNPGRELDALKSKTWAYSLCETCGEKYQARKIYLKRPGRKFCSQKCSHSAHTKNPIQEFNGVRYYLTVQGYMENPDKNLKMHREVWRLHNGEIPDGMIIHHVNDNKIDNRIENLELISWGDHSSKHSKERWASGMKMGKPKGGKCLECDRPSKALKLCTMHYQRKKAALKAMGVKV